MKRPSRDQLGWFSSPGSCVRWRSDPPSASIVQMSQCPSSPRESKAILRPSGDQRGEPCESPGPWVSCTGLDPSAVASQISCPRRRAKTRRRIGRPSGEKCGLKLVERRRGRGLGRAPRLEPVDVHVVTATARRRGGSGSAAIVGEKAREPGDLDPLGRAAFSDPRPASSRVDDSVGVDQRPPVAGPGETSPQKTGPRQASRRPLSARSPRPTRRRQSRTTCRPMQDP